MPTASFCAAPILSTQLRLGLCRPVIGARNASLTVFKLKLHPGFSPSSDNFRFKDTLKLQIRRRLYTVHASDPRQSAGDSLKESSDGSNDVPQGPPLLTILAGVIVFFIVCWIMGSIVMWLIDLIFSISLK